jgi:alpha-methylacyl-CoA racemase
VAARPNFDMNRDKVTQSASKPLRPLDGIRVVEVAGLAPGPYCGMILADFGAEVVRVDRIGAWAFDRLGRGKRSLDVDLKKPEGVDVVLRLADKADVLIEPFRPGVAERLGIGPDVVLARNPALIYARMTGWGQEGPYAKMAGHDINYIALSGALSLIGRNGEKPLPPINLLGDFAGGGMLCAMGILLALIERSRSGKGQIVDAAMVDGAAYIAAIVFMLRAVGWWDEERGTNMLDTGAYFYETYETRDHKYVAVGAIEPQFYAALLKGMDLDPATLPDQHDRASWPGMKQRFAAIFAQRTRDEWCAVFDGTDACVAPVLELDEVGHHPHNQARHLLFQNERGGREPGPAPRLSRTPGMVTGPLPEPGQHTMEILTEHGFTEREIRQLQGLGAIGGRPE